MKWRPGFTLPELIIVVGILTILFTVGSQSLLTSQHQVSVNSSLSQLITDIKLQQSKAMWGDTEGRATTDNYGVSLNSNHYILFHGSVGNPDDVTVDLDNSITVGPDGQVFIFAKGRGEIMGYDSSADTITISSPSDSKTVEFNQYGVIISEN